MQAAALACSGGAWLPSLAAVVRQIDAATLRRMAAALRRARASASWAWAATVMGSSMTSPPG
jgi:hypothetical protein